MTRKEIEDYLNPLHTWKYASYQLKNGFGLVMNDKHYGRQETIDAWLWYQSGWTDYIHYMVK